MQLYNATGFGTEKSETPFYVNKQNKKQYNVADSIRWIKMIVLNRLNKNNSNIMYQNKIIYHSFPSLIFSWVQSSHNHFHAKFLQFL